MIKEINILDGTEIIRYLNDEEKLANKASAAKAKENQIEMELLEKNNLESKLALLDKLGITEDEARLLLG